MIWFKINSGYNRLLESYFTHTKEDNYLTFINKHKSLFTVNNNNVFKSILIHSDYAKIALVENRIMHIAVLIAMAGKIIIDHSLLLHSNLDNVCEFCDGDVQNAGNYPIDSSIWSSLSPPLLSILINQWNSIIREWYKFLEMLNYLRHAVWYLSRKKMMNNRLKGAKKELNGQLIVTDWTENFGSIGEELGRWLVKYLDFFR